MNGIESACKRGFPILNLGDAKSHYKLAVHVDSKAQWTNTAKLECLLRLIAFGAKGQSKHSFANKRQCLRITNTGKYSLSVDVLLLLQLLKSFVAFRWCETPFF